MTYIGRLSLIYQKTSHQNLQLKCIEMIKKVPIHNINLIILTKVHEELINKNNAFYFIFYLPLLFYLLLLTNCTRYT